MKNHSRDSKSILLRVLLYLFVILVVLVTLYPYFVMFTTAAKSRAEIYSPEGTLLPIQWLWQNFKDIWTLAPLSRYFLNSLIVAGGSTLIAIVCGIPAAYALARMKFKGKKVFLGIVIISQMFAPVVLLVGIYIPYNFTSFHNAFLFFPFLRRFLSYALKTPINFQAFLYIFLVFLFLLMFCLPVFCQRILYKRDNDNEYNKDYRHCRRKTYFPVYRARLIYVVDECVS